VKFWIVAEGKLKEQHFRGLADLYLERLARYARVEERELKSSADFERSLPPEAFVVALEVDGKELTSSALAQLVARWTSQGKGEVAFLIGGAEGIPEATSKRAHAKISLSKLTLPHRLARVVLLEQLYRAMTILRGEPYAREG
jgi:23S rRNA (pseudouridine1915-N3)-methyltransferase